MIDDTPETLKVTLSRGKPLSLDLVMKDDDGATPFDLTGWSFQAQVRKKPNAPEVLGAVTLTVAGDATDGVLTAEFGESLLWSLAGPATYFSDLRMTKSGEKPLLPLKFEITMEPTVSRPAGVSA